MEKFHLLTLQSRNALTDSFLTFAISSMGISLSLAPCGSLSFSPMSDSPSAVLELQKVKTQLQTEKTKSFKVEELQADEAFLQSQLTSQGNGQSSSSGMLSLLFVCLFKISCTAVILFRRRVM